MSVTPLRLALNSFILALKDSALAFECLSLKKLRMLSKFVFGSFLVFSGLIMSIKKFDAIIVGAGPSGVTCAVELAKSGLQIALLDKATFPRDKTCGDALSLDVTNQLAWISKDLLSQFETFAHKMPSYGVKIVAPNNIDIDIPFIYKGKNKCGHICKRIDFDNFLFQFAKKQKNIHVFENTQVKKIVQNTDGVSVETNQNSFESKIIIGADGAQSIVAKQLGNIKVDKKYYCAGLRVYYKNVIDFHKDNYIELHFFKGVLPGYLWIFKLPNNSANVGIGLRSDAISKKKINLKQTLQNLIKTHPRLKERFKNAEPSETIKGYGLPLGSKKRTISGDRFLLTGDAASLIDPFSGEGIANAIRSGRVAASHLIKCFDENNFSAKFNLQYDKEIYRRMWKEFKISRTLQNLSKYPWILNLIAKKASTNTYLQQFLVESLEDPEKKKLLTKPGFYYQLLFK